MRACWHVHPFILLESLCPAHTITTVLFDQAARLGAVVIKFGLYYVQQKQVHSNNFPT